MHYSPQELLNRRELFNNGVVNLQDFNELKYVLLYDCKKRKKKKKRQEHIPISQYVFLKSII